MTVVKAAKSSNVTQNVPLVASANNHAFENDVDWRMGTMIGSIKTARSNIVTSECGFLPLDDNSPD